MKNTHDEKALKSLIDEGIAADVILLFGGEKYLVKHYGQMIVKKIAADEVMVYRQENFKIDELCDAATMVPFGGGSRCIVLTDIDIDGMSRTDFDKLCEVVSMPLSMCKMIFLYPTADFGVKPGQNSKNFIAKIRETGAVAELKKRNEQDIATFIGDRVKANGCTISRGNSVYLLSRCGDDMNQLSVEIDKLCAYCSGSEATKSRIDTVTTEQLSTSVFEISKRLASGDLGGALCKLSDLSEQREEPVAILAALSSAFVDLYRAKVASARGIDEKRIAQYYNYERREFRITNAMRDCRKYQGDALEDIIRVLITADKDLKSSRVDKRIILDGVVAKIFMILNGRRAVG